jgi:type II secretory pathway pseudopilin PulG
MRIRSRRRGITLFSLLIVLAILAILIGLLLPAVQKVREAAARTQSQNNLKQIALGVLNYESTYRTFPSGNDANNFSAAAQLLPFIEQQELFKTIDFKKSIDDEANAKARKALVKVYISPLDPVLAVDATKYGPTNYLFNAGSRPALADNDGVFYQDSKVRIVDITDGTSNTLLAGETFKGDGGTKAVTVLRQHVALDKDALEKVKPDSGVQDWKDGKHIAGNRCASWMDGRFLQGTCNSGLKINDNRPDVTCAGLGGVSSLRSDGSGINAGLCDGSVRYITTAISLETWKAVTTRAGGEVLGADF